MVCNSGSEQGNTSWSDWGGATSVKSDSFENNGVLVYLLDFDDNNFTGINVMVNGCPYIAINKNINPERQRFTITLELVHMAFFWNENMDEKECEHIMDGIAGAFLFPAKDAIRELGINRGAIQADMMVPAKEFGISMMCLAYRAKKLEIVSENAYKNFIIRASQCGWS